MFYNKEVATVSENGKNITLFSLALPLLLEGVFLLMYGTANTLLLSGYSDVAVSATSVSQQIINSAIVLLEMVVKGSVILSSIALGARKFNKAARISSTGGITVAVLGAVFGAVILVFAQQFTSLMNLSGEVQRLGIEYTVICAASLPLTVFLTFINNMLICNGYSKCTLAVGLGGNIINIILSLIALYSGITLPFSGVAAVALAGVAAKALSIVAAVYFFVKMKCPFGLCFEFKTLLKILKFGVPAGMCIFSFNLSQTVTTSFVASLGVTVINTKVYITNIVTYTSRISVAMGNANSILMGRHRGAGRFDSIKILFRQNLTIAILCNLVLSFLAFAFHRTLLSLFTKDEQIIKSAAIIMFIDIFLELGRAINHITENSLNANGDVKITLIISVASCWIFSVILAFLLCIKAQFGLVGLWIAFAADELFKGVAYLIRWHSGRWKITKI